MRRAGNLLLAATMLSGLATGAQARCSSAAEQSAFDIGALKSELSVLAVACSDEDDYNHFVERDRGELVRADAVVNSWFKRTFGRTAQQRYDSYITLLANEQGLKGQHEGGDFCARLKPVFAETMVVPVASLPEYAAAKDVFPLDMACEVSASPGPAIAAARSGHTTTTRHKK
jgi:hypothetical protein